MTFIGMSPRRTMGAEDVSGLQFGFAARDVYAVIPPRKNAKPWKPASAEAIARNEAVSAQR